MTDKTVQIPGSAYLEKLVDLGDGTYAKKSVGAFDQTSSAPKGTASFTPAATPHLAGDVVGGAVQFTWTDTPVTGKSLLITGSELEIDGATVEATGWRLHLYSVTPPSALADDAAWDLPSGDRASYLGYIDLGTAIDVGSTQWVESSQLKQIKLATTELWGYLVDLTALTPAAVVHKVNLQTQAV